MYHPSPRVRNPSPSLAEVHRHRQRSTRGLEDDRDFACHRRKAGPELDLDVVAALCFRGDEVGDVGTADARAFWPAVASDGPFTALVGAYETRSAHFEYKCWDGAGDLSVHLGAILGVAATASTELTDTFATVREGAVRLHEAPDAPVATAEAAVPSLSKAPSSEEPAGTIRQWTCSPASAPPRARVCSESHHSTVHWTEWRRSNESSQLVSDPWPAFGVIAACSGRKR